MRRRRTTPALGLLAILVFGATLCACTVGSRYVVTEEREVEGFREVVFAAIGELMVEQGSTESLVIEAESNVLRRIRTEVRGETLHIEMQSTFPAGWNVVLHG